METYASATAISTTAQELTSKDYTSAQVYEAANNGEQWALEAFDFTKYDVDLFTIEYNDAVNRSIVHNIMTNNGYDAVDIDDSGEDRFIKNRRE